MIYLYILILLKLDIIKKINFEDYINLIKLNL